MVKLKKQKLTIILLILLVFNLPSLSATDVTIDGNNIMSNNINGLGFKGFGVLSANGTSALLLDYKAHQLEKYIMLLKILFGGTNPLMTHVKIEMGNDRNNSTGPDPCTMRVANEEANVKRHPAFQLAKDAKKFNPDLKVSLLRWNSPAWANTNDKVYTWYKNTILTAYRTYGYMVDYVNPGLNERAPDLTWTKQYADRVKNDTSGFENQTERNLYNNIKIVISDEVGTGSFGTSLVSDSGLRNLVSVAAFHYNTEDDSAGNFKKLADQYDFEVWNSEAQATFSNSAFRPNNNMRDPSIAGTGIGGINGPLEMGNTIIKGFSHSRRTHFVYQPAIGSFYEGGQYSFKELLSARDPWSGWIHFDAGLVILRHFSFFAKTGWENSTNSKGIWRALPQSSYTGATGTNPINGRNGTPSYLTMASPDKQNFSIVFINDSEYTQNYNLRTINMAYTGNPALEMWETRAADPGKAFNSNYMKYLGDVSANGNGLYSITLKPYSIMTVSTLTNKLNPEITQALPVEAERTVLDTDATGKQQDLSDNILYADDFDYSEIRVPQIDTNGQISGTDSYIESRGGTKSAIPRFTSDRNGAFEAYLPTDSTNYILRQQIDEPTMGLGETWNNGDPITAIGDLRWLNYKASVDVSFENNSVQGGKNYAALGARQQGGGSSHNMNGTPYYLKFWFDGGWMLKVDGTTVANGNVANGSGGVTISGFDTAYNAWHKLALEVVDNQVTAYLDNIKLASYTDTNPRLSGRVDLASGYYYTRFDNLKVETIEGKVPYYSELLDNLEMYDLSATPVKKLIYTGSWAHENGKSMYNYHRTLSTSQSANATLCYTFTGTGIDIIGPNDGSARLEVSLDNQIVETSAATAKTGDTGQTYMIKDLEYAEHTVIFKLISGKLVVDSVGIRTSANPGNIPSPTATAAPTPTPEPQENPVFTGGPYILKGTSDYENLPNGLTDELGDFTIACRVNLPAITPWSRIFDFGSNTSIFMMMTPASGATGLPYFCITLNGTEGEQGLNGSTAFPTNTDQHIAITKKGNTGTLYINGLKIDQNNSMTLSPSDMGNSLYNYIGRSQWEHDPYLEGSIDDFRIYNRAISEAEIKELAEGSQQGMRGDANKDGIINIVDALLIAQHYVGLPITGVFIEKNADVDCSTTINIVDALLVAQFYVKLIDSISCME
ncbi:MAG: hypothetical protein JXR70_14525 [Spirochaetales bacterium]|nr:hypothetical protein [Spirochaetales bacterium]